MTTKDTRTNKTTHHALLQQQVPIFVHHPRELVDEMSRRQFKDLVGLVQVLLGEYGLIEAVIPDETFARVSLVPEGGVDVGIDGPVLVRVELLLDAAKEERGYFFQVKFDKTSLQLLFRERRNKSRLLQRSVVVVVMMMMMMVGNLGLRGLHLWKRHPLWYAGHLLRYLLYGMLSRDDAGRGPVALLRYRRSDLNGDGFRIVEEQDRH